MKDASAQEKPVRTDPSALRREVVSIGRHSSVYVVGQAVSRAVGFFMIPVYTRFIAPANYGAMEMIEILASAVAILIAMNVADAMPRFYYAEKENTARNHLVSTTIIGFGLIGLPVVLLFLWLSKYLSVLITDDPTYLFYLQVAILAAWFGMICEIGYSYLRMRYMAKTFVAVTIAQLGVALSLNIYMVVFKRMDILGIFYSTLIAQGLTALILAAAILKSVGLVFSLPLLRRLVRFGLPMVPSSIGLMLGFVSDRFFLRWLGASDPAIALAQVGLFSLGFKFGVIVNRFITVPFNAFWGPRRLELLIKGVPEAKETVVRICTYSAMGTIFFALLLSSGIESLIEIMADPSYRGAHQVVPFIVLAFVVSSLETHFSTGILYHRKTAWTTYIGFLGLAVVLVWNYLFVPRYGIFGAATSNLAGLVVRCGLIYAVSQRLYPIPFEMGRIAVLFVTAFILYAVTQTVGFPSPYLTFFSRMGLVALFPFVLFLVGFYREGELEFVGQGLRKGRKTAEALYVKIGQPR